MASCGKPDPEKIRGKLHLPRDGYVADVGRGQVSYQASCAICHGPGGRGTRQGPPLLDLTYRPDHHHDLAFHLAVKNGVKQHHWQFGHMPPVKGVSPEDVADIVAYVRTEQRKAGIE
jgi:mono/diheme cytochrome c family protein